ncbi:hypothetical protein BSIN_4380 [Burkholderia singularis]|uniref:Uncharacterized protein n=1 Tax=Burkholderia singularis TaxID=1503053 RepID=A0A238H7T6_9BURK|nr:hypothetical protein BSIN_4380 [Burkholderia singularis]
MTRNGRNRQPAVRQSASDTGMRYACYRPNARYKQYEPLDNERFARTGTAGHATGQSR